MKLHRALIKALILLLLFAQQAAFAHAISHIGKQPPANEQLAHSKLCDKCVSFEKISGVAPTSPPPLLALQLVFTPPSQASRAFTPRTVVVFQGRGPPVFL
jgi:hypothetical protein